MAREFDFGAEVAEGGGKVFRNPELGAHDAIVAGIVHVGSFQDVFKKGSSVEVKAPANVVLVKLVLMNPDSEEKKDDGSPLTSDKNEDGSRIAKWIPIPLKKGDRANLTKFMKAVDPAEVKSGFDEVIGTPLTTNFVADEKGGKNDDGSWKYVNLDSYGSIAARSAALVKADAEDEGLTLLGHIRFNDISDEVLDDIPPHLIRQYLLSEGRNGGKNLSYEGSAAEKLIAAKREADPTWATRREGDNEDDKPQADAKTEKTSAVPQEAPAPDAPAPEGLNENAEY